MKKLKLDTINRNLIVELQNSGRISNNDLGEIINLSASACFNRTKMLEDAKIIKKYIAVVDIDKVCEVVMCYVMIRLNGKIGNNRFSFQNKISKEEEIVDCSRVLGGVDYIAFVTCQSLEALEKLSDRILDMEEVDTLQTYVVSGRFKFSTGYPLNKLKWRDRSS